MKQLKLKPEYDGMSVNLKHPKLGELTFLSDTDPERYPFYFENGFSELFEPIVPQITKAEGEKKPIKYFGIHIPQSYKEAKDMSTSTDKIEEVKPKKKAPRKNKPKGKIE